MERELLCPICNGRLMEADFSDSKRVLTVLICSRCCAVHPGLDHERCEDGKTV